MKKTYLKPSARLTITVPAAHTIRTAGGSFYELWLTKRPFYIITAMLYLCDAVHPSNKLREDISQLIEEYAHLPVQRMGFFDGWNQEPIWAIGKG